MGMVERLAVVIVAAGWLLGGLLLWLGLSTSYGEVPTGAIIGIALAPVIISGAIWYVLVGDRH